MNLQSMILPKVDPKATVRVGRVPLPHLVELAGSKQI